MKHLLLLSLIFVSSLLYSQQSLNARLGYPEDAKLLIIHSDDVGVSHSENMGTFQAIEKGVVNSGSVMMPCPWVPEVATYVKAHPEVDFGLHLTLTAEWKTMKWGPTAPTSKVPSIVNDKGYLYADCMEFGQHANAAEAKIELRSQIDKAIKMGIQPTHLDSHMGCLLFSSVDVFKAYLELGREYGIPVMVSRFFLKAAPASYLEAITDQDVIIENAITAGPKDYENGLDNYYINVLKTLPAGVNVLLIHTALDNAEMQSLTIDHPYWGADWRQQDYDFFTSNQCRQLIKEEGIIVIQWRDIQKVVYEK